MARSAGAPTRTDDLRGRLRLAILRGVYEVGAHLPVADLAAEHGVSTAVVREALTRLEARGLVVSEPNRGFRVRPLEPGEVETIVELRIQVETAALRRSIERADTAWEAELVAARHRLSVSERMIARGKGELDEWLDAHEAFHTALAAGSGSKVVEDVRLQLYDASELYRSRAVRAKPRRNAAAEHTAIVEAAVGRDARTACRLLTEHLRTTAAALPKR